MKNAALYPLKFDPVFKYYLWGGSRLKTLLNKIDEEEKIAESWEISSVDGNETRISNGDLKGRTIKDLIQKYGAEFLGNSVQEKYGDKFPLLIKFIDAEKPLSIQVHPNDDMARKRHNSFGKNEMWYIMDAEDEAELLVGFDKEIGLDEYKKHLVEGTILDVLHHEKISSGHTFYIPAGRVHAIGAGVILAEIQQTSDLTYRIYDYDRVDAKTGEKRPLHNELAYDVIDFNVHESYHTDYEKKSNTSNILVHSPYFLTNIILVDGEVQRDYSELDSFIIYMCVEGNASLVHDGNSYALNYGECILLPAFINNVILKADKAKVIEINV